MYYARHTIKVVSLFVAAVAQLVEPWIVIPVVVGSSPISRPTSYLKTSFINLVSSIDYINQYKIIASEF